MPSSLGPRQRNEIAHLIIELLKATPKLKAVELKDILNQDLKKPITTHDVNSVLYRELRTEVNQDDGYRWSIREQGTLFVDPVPTVANPVALVDPVVKEVCPEKKSLWGQILLLLLERTK